MSLPQIPRESETLVFDRQWIRSLRYSSAGLLAVLMPYDGTNLLAKPRTVLVKRADLPADLLAALEAYTGAENMLEVQAPDPTKPVRVRLFRGSQLLSTIPDLFAIASTDPQAGALLVAMIQFFAMQG